MIRITTFLALWLGATGMVLGQNDADVRRYSANYFSGTARFESMGGAFGALGGDMSSVHLNPAAVSVFRFGEVSFTPAYEFTGINSVSDFTGQESTKSKLVVNNVGFVLANDVRHPKWRSINFSVSFNRINTFNDQAELTGRSSAINGLAGDFLFEAQGSTVGQLSSFGGFLAWDTFVIDNADFDEDDDYIDNGNYILGFDPDEIVETRQRSERDGRMSETALTLGANYDDKLYLGFGLGFQDIYYQTTVETRESPVDEPMSFLQNYTLTERLESDGLGVNAKLGFIYRFQNLRFGASVKTPTVFSMTDNFTSEIESEYLNSDGDLASADSQSDAGFFEYRIRTPWHFMASVAGVIGTNAIVSAQYERIDFSGGELRNSGAGADADFSQINQDIARFYSSSDVFRFGAEYRLGKSFAIRGGYSFFANPIEINEQASNEDLDRQEFAFGLGFRQATWSIDFSYSKILVNEFYSYTDLNDAILEYDQNIFALTLGVRL